MIKPTHINMYVRDADYNTIYDRTVPIENEETLKEINNLLDKIYRRFHKNRKKRLLKELQMEAR